MNFLSAREMGELAGGKPRAAPVSLELVLVCPDGANPAPSPGRVLPQEEGEVGASPQNLRVLPRLRTLRWLFSQLG